MKILLIHPQNYLQRHETGVYRRSLRYAPLAYSLFDKQAAIRIL